MTMTPEPDDPQPVDVIADDTADAARLVRRLPPAHLMSITQAAARMNCSRTRLYLLRQSGEGPTWHKDGHRYWYEAASVDAWIDAEGKQPYGLPGPEHIEPGLENAPMLHRGSTILTTTQVAHWLKVSVAMIVDLTTKDGMPHFEFHRIRRYDKAEVYYWLRQRAGLMQ